METKHTPGPWWYDLDPKYIDSLAIRASVQIVATVWGTEQEGEAGQENQNNARLIAAAPELLEAAQALVSHLSDMEGGKWLRNRAGEELQTAISKATT